MLEASAPDEPDELVPSPKLIRPLFLTLTLLVGASLPPGEASEPKPTLAQGVVGLRLPGQEGPGGDADDESHKKELRVKAAFLHHFMKFTTWPKESFEKKDSPLQLVIVGDDPFGDVLDDTFEDKVIGGRSVTITRMEEVPEELEAHVVFTSGLGEEELDTLFELLGDKATLLVGDQTDFAIQGGHCNFYRNDSRVAFEINPERAKACGLSISSELLKLARIVPKKGEGTS